MFHLSFHFEQDLIKVNILCVYTVYCILLQYTKVMLSHDSCSCDHLLGKKKFSMDLMVLKKNYFFLCKEWKLGEKKAIQCLCYFPLT